MPWKFGSRVVRGSESSRLLDAVVSRESESRREDTWGGDDVWYEGIAVDSGRRWEEVRFMRDCPPVSQ